MEDYSQLVREVVLPKIMETCFVKQLAQLEALFSKENRTFGGSKITIPIRTSVSSNAAAYDKSDVDPVAGTFVAKDATWTKKYYHTAAEVHGIDKAQAEGGGQPSVANLIQDAIKMEMDKLWEVIYDAVYTQIKADIDSAATYSDAALNRVTYPTLASYEEDTATPITLSILRTCSNTTRLDKLCGPKGGYTWIMQEKVYERFEPLVAMLHAWNIDGKGGSPIDGGYQAVGNFEGVPVATPQGMTTGDVFFCRRQDVKILNHRTLTIEQVPSGRDSAMFVPRLGINAYVENPGFQGKMTDKN